jgi:hypothetical protein
MCKCRLAPVKTSAGVSRDVTYSHGCLERLAGASSAGGAPSASGW